MRRKPERFPKKPSDIALVLFDLEEFLREHLGITLIVIALLGIPLVYNVVNRPTKSLLTHQPEVRTVK